MKAYAPTDRTQVRRLKKRASYDKAMIHAILDEALIAHVGFIANGQPFVIPTLFVRDGEQLFLHGSIASRMLKTLEQGVDLCVTISLIDGLVLARSAFHHSVNYRSVVVLGKAQLVTDRNAMLRAMHLLTNHVVPNRWEEVRTPNELELKQTHVLALPLDEVSAKVRDGGPIDDAEDYALAVWSGVVPLRLQRGQPIADARLHPDAKALDIGRFIAPN
jgi:nitroimidazol reductase NimA-like FMN-containing flavoprotein (pyridoxamine 5'-phosphate oxidase superfamily)